MKSKNTYHLDFVTSFSTYQNTTMLQFYYFFYAFWAQIVGPSWVQNGKKTIFIPATSLPTKFSLKTKFLTASLLKHYAN